MIQCDRRAFGGFLRTQVILVAFQAILKIVVGLAFGLPYLFLTTLVVAIAMFIPFFGPPLALAKAITADQSEPRTDELPA